MKNLVFIFALLLMSVNLFADDHNTPVPAEGTMTATVIKPLSSTYNDQIPRSFDVIRYQVRTITADNEWTFPILGEPGKNVQVNLFAPVPIPADDGHPTLSGTWYGPAGENLGSGGPVPVEEQFPMPAESFFDVFYELEEIDATGADLGNKTYKLEVRFWYADL